MPCNRSGPAVGVSISRCASPPHGCGLQHPGNPNPVRVCTGITNHVVTSLTPTQAPTLTHRLPSPPLQSAVGNLGCTPEQRVRRRQTMSALPLRRAGKANSVGRSRGRRSSNVKATTKRRSTKPERVAGGKVQGQSKQVLRRKSMQMKSDFISSVLDAQPQPTTPAPKTGNRRHSMVNPRGAQSARLPTRRMSLGVAPRAPLR